MKLTGRIVGAHTDFKTGKPTISFEVNERSEFEVLVDEMRDKDKLSIDLKADGRLACLKVGMRTDYSSC